MRLVDNQPFYLALDYKRDPVVDNGDEITKPLFYLSDNIWIQFKLECLDDNALKHGNPSDWSFNNGNATGNIAGFCHTPGAATTATQAAVLTIGGYYKVEITISGSTHGTVTVVMGSATSYFDKNGAFDIYLTTDSVDMQIIMSADFDGCVKGITARRYLDLPSSPSDILLTNTSTSSAFNLGALPNVTVTKDWYTLRFKPSDLSIYPGCYKLTYNNCTLTTNESNEVELVDPDIYNSHFVFGKVIPPIKKVTATATCFGYGFDWTNFTLFFRVPFAKFNPEYELLIEDYEDSTFYNVRQRGERAKKYTARTYAFDEPIHDCLTLMLMCPVFKVEDVEYYLSKKEYNLTDIDKDGTVIATAAEFTLKKQQNTPSFSNCEDCDGNMYYGDYGFEYGA